MYKFDIDYNCKNTIRHKKYNYEIKEELLGIDKINDKTNVSKIYENNFKNLIKSLDLINIVKYEDDIPCEDNKEGLNALICKTKLTNVIKKERIIDETDELEMYTEILKEVTKMEGIYKPENQQLLFDSKLSELTDYKNNVAINVNLLSEIINDNELNCIIMPELSQLNINKIEELQHIKQIQTAQIASETFKLEHLDIIYYFLSEINFNCYFYDISGINNLDLLTQDKSYARFIERIKKHIINFIQKKFVYDNTDYLKEINILIDITIDENSTPYMIFTVQNRFDQIYVKPYYDVYKTINVNDFIQNIEQNIHNTIYKIERKPRYEVEKLLADKKDVSSYKINFDGHKDWKETPVENPQDTQEFFNFNILKKHVNDIKIYSNYYPLNRYQKNCARSLVIELNDVFYVVNFMSITVDVYNTLKKLSRHNMFMDDYNKTLESLTFNGTEKNGFYTTDRLPSVLKILIQRVDKAKLGIEYKFFYSETPANYSESRSSIANEVKIKIDIVLTFLWYNQYRQIFNQIQKLFEQSEYKKVIKYKLFFLEERELIKKIIGNSLYVSTDMDFFLDMTDKMLNIPPIAYALVSFISYSENYFLFYKMSNIVEIIQYYMETEGKINRRDLRLKIDNLSCGYEAFEKIMKVNYVNFTRLLDELFSQEITKKSFFLFIHDYIELSQFSYIAWNVPPSLEITDHDKLLDYLDVIVEYVKCNAKKGDYKIKQIATYITKDIATFQPKYSDNRTTINNFCNFYELYQRGQFIYNIREASISNLKELKELLIKRGMNDYIAFFHYFNTDNYNILHCHIYQDYFITQDLTGKKIDMSYGRPILLSRINTEIYDDRTDYGDIKPYAKKNMIVAFKESESDRHTIGKFILKFYLHHMKGYNSRAKNFTERLQISEIEKTDYAIEDERHKAKLSQTGSEMKYLKYKQKYLKLKKQLNLI